MMEEFCVSVLIFFYFRQSHFIQFSLPYDIILCEYAFLFYINIFYKGGLMDVTVHAQNVDLYCCHGNHGDSDDNHLCKQIQIKVKGI